MFEVFFNSVNELVEMSESDKDLCYKYFEEVEYPKNTIIEPAGSIPGHQYFIISGFMRNYYQNEKGSEITTDINDGIRFFTSYNY